MMSVTLGLQLHCPETKNSGSSGQEVYSGFPETNKNNSFLSLGPPVVRSNHSDWMGLQPHQFSSFATMQYPSHLQQMQLTQLHHEENQYVYASLNNNTASTTSNTLLNTQLPLNLSTPENQLVQASPSGYSSYFTNNGSNFNATTQLQSVTEESKRVNSQYSPDTKLNSSELNAGATSKCNCKRKSKRIPRPRNAFILFRLKHHLSVFGDSSGKKSNAEISRELGYRWRHLSLKEREYWNTLAREEKVKHAKKYPDYRYAPRRNGKKTCYICDPKSPGAKGLVNKRSDTTSQPAIELNPQDVQHKNTSMSFAKPQPHQAMHQTNLNSFGQLTSGKTQLAPIQNCGNYNQRILLGQVGATNNMNFPNSTTTSLVNSSHQQGLVNSIGQINQGPYYENSTNNLTMMNIPSQTNMTILSNDTIGQAQIPAFYSSTSGCENFGFNQERYYQSFYDLYQKDPGNQFNTAAIPGWSYSTPNSNNALNYKKHFSQSLNKSNN